MGEREGDKMAKFYGKPIGSGPSVTAGWCGVWGSCTGDLIKRPGGGGRDLEMGPGLRRGDMGDGVGLEQGPMARQVQSPRVRAGGRVVSVADRRMRNRKAGCHVAGRNCLGGEGLLVG